MTLNNIGKKTKRAIIAYLKEINEYRKIEEHLLIDNTAYQFQLYMQTVTAAEQAMAAGDTTLSIKLHSTAQKFYVNYQNNLKTIGVSAIQRKKLAKEEPTAHSEGSIFTIIQEARNENN